MCVSVQTLVSLQGAQYLCQGCQLSRFSWKLPKFQAYITRVRFFDKTPDFRHHFTFPATNINKTLIKEPTRNLFHALSEGAKRPNLRAGSYWCRHSVEIAFRHANSTCILTMIHSR